MSKLTPMQESFSAGEISPLMHNRTETEGYKQGVAELTNMFADSRGPAISRGGSKFIQDFLGDDARVMSVPVNDNFFYTAIFLANKLLIGSIAGHNPAISHTSNSNFNLGDDSWTPEDDGNATSSVIFVQGGCTMSVDKKNSRWAYITQQFTVPAAGDYRLIWDFSGNSDLTIKIGVSADDGSIVENITTSGDSDLLFSTTSTTIWVTARLDSDNVDVLNIELDYLGVSPEGTDLVSFDTPYLEEHLGALQGVESPSGGAVYVLHESYSPYKLSYDRENDSFSWAMVSFTDPPPEWQAGSYPSAGDFFEGRLWLGGTVNEPQTFWASKSGVPEDFTQGTLADDGLQFTMAKYGRIEWLVGFKNLVIGTQNGEHIVTSEGGFIQPDDIQVEQQSSYGSANIQPVQVGDQIFYVSADRRKLRAIQYEWQKDNWLSKDLTFNSEHITKAGIKHITWQQNPYNLFHCILNDGTVATLTYERGHDVYGWGKMSFFGEVIDLITGPIQGTDHLNGMIKNRPGELNFEAFHEEDHHKTELDSVVRMDSWVERNTEPDLVTVMGLEHLEGFTVRILIDNGSHPDRIVVGGEITLQSPQPETADIHVGLQFTPKIKTLSIDQMMQGGGSQPYMKRWNKIYIRVLASTMPLINGERAPERFPSIPMGEPQPPVDQEILKINLGFSRKETITIEQDLPHALTVLGIYGELGQEIL